MKNLLSDSCLPLSLFLLLAQPAKHPSPRLFYFLRSIKNSAGARACLASYKNLHQRLDDPRHARDPPPPTTTTAPMRGARCSVRQSFQIAHSYLLETTPAPAPAQTTTPAATTTPLSTTPRKWIKSGRELVRECC